MDHITAAKTARKLIQLQRQAATPGEARAAACALALIIDKHRLSDADLQAAGNAEREPFYADEMRPLYAWKRLEPWRRDLGLVLCDHFGVAYWQRTVGLVGRASEQSLHICGRPSDLEIVRQLYAWLTTEIVRLAARECRGHGASYAHNYKNGFVAGLDLQLRVARQATAAEEPRAIVLYERGAEADRYLKSLLGDLKTVRWRSQAELNPRAWRRGASRGEQLHLGARMADGGRDPQLGLGFGDPETEG